MRVTLGRKGDYSVRAMLDVAHSYGHDRRKARQIAAAMEIPERYLSQILAHLVRAGLLTAVAGPDGGYSLSRPPAEVTLLEVVEAAEGPITLDECVLRGGPCDWSAACPVHEAWSGAQRALTDRLAATSFEALAAIDASIEAGDYSPPAEAPPHRTPTLRRGART